MMTRNVQARRITNQPIPYVNRLALWGEQGCGKDTWLATLQFIGEKSGFFLRPFDEVTARWQADAWMRIARGDFPRATKGPGATDELQLLTFELSSHSSSGLFLRQQNVLLQIPQAAGGWWIKPFNDQQADMPNPYQYLAYSAGIICLLDPTVNDLADRAATLMTMLDYLDLYRRQYKRRHAIRIALWLTKMDHPQHQQKRGSIEAYAHTLFGPRLTNFLSKYSRSGDYEFRWGGCSAVGTITYQGRIRSNTYWDYSCHDHNDLPHPVQRILDPRALQPEGVLDPLCWVIEPILSNTPSLHPNLDNFVWGGA